MHPSVRVERVSEGLPEHKQASYELRPDGTIVFFLPESDITLNGAEALQVLLNIARGAYHQAWDLPEVPAAAHVN